MSTALAVTDTAPAYMAAPQGYSQAELDLIRETVAAGTTETEFRLFIAVCQQTGLSPFARQIYAIVRGKDDKRKMTVQTGIDGYRLLAARTGALAGIDEPVYDTEDAKHPNKATVTVYRLIAGQRVPFTASARWAEYKPDYGAQMWDKMPYLMLGKCAEALALRKAFPAEISGVYTAEEMAQADTEPVTYIEAAQATDHRKRIPVDEHGNYVPSDPPKLSQMRAAPKSTPKPAGNGNGTWNPLADREFRMAMNALDYRSVAQVEEWLKSQNITDRTAAMDAIQTETAARTNTTAVDAEYTYEVADNGDPDLLRQVGTNGVH